jgi:hypothetical protein
MKIDNLTSVEYDSGNNTLDNTVDVNVSKAALSRKLISDTYTPEGNVHDCEFRTTLELQYEFQEMRYIPEDILIEVLNAMQFRLQYIDDRPHWVLYRKSSGIPD